MVSKRVGLALLFGTVALVQPSRQALADEAGCLVVAAWDEARGEPEPVIEAVISTIVNRAKSRGLSICDAVMDPYAFTGVTPAMHELFAEAAKPHGTLTAQPNTGHDREQLAIVEAAAKAALAGTLPDRSNGATHFYSPAGMRDLGLPAAPGWAGAMTRTANVGPFIFLREANGFQPPPNPRERTTEILAAAEPVFERVVPAAPPLDGREEMVIMPEAPPSLFAWRRDPAPAPYPPRIAPPAMLDEIVPPGFLPEYAEAEREFALTPAPPLDAPAIELAEIAPPDIVAERDVEAEADQELVAFTAEPFESRTIAPLAIRKTPLPIVQIASGALIPNEEEIVQVAWRAAAAAAVASEAPAPPSGQLSATLVAPAEPAAPAPAPAETRAAPAETWAAFPAPAPPPQQTQPQLYERWTNPGAAPPAPKRYAALPLPPSAPPRPATVVSYYYRPAPPQSPSYVSCRSRLGRLFILPVSWFSAHKRAPGNLRCG